MKSLSLLLAAVPLVAPAKAQGVGYEEGQFLPDLMLPTIEGDRSIRLSELRGTKVLLIHFASW